MARARKTEHMPTEQDVANMYDAALADVGLIIKFEVWFEGNYGVVFARGYKPGNVRRAGCLYEEQRQYRPANGQTVAWACYHAALAMYVKADRTPRTDGKLTAEI